MLAYCMTSYHEACRSDLPGLDLQLVDTWILRVSENKTARSESRISRGLATGSDRNQDIDTFCDASPLRVLVDFSAGVSCELDTTGGLHFLHTPSPLKAVTVLKRRSTKRPGCCYRSGNTRLLQKVIEKYYGVGCELTPPFTHVRKVPRKRSF